jgi:pimeloyl-ACP methyl ester carboxylesterase
MTAAVAVALSLVLAPAPQLHTRATQLEYRAHDGTMRPAWLLLPRTYRGGPIPLVISPHDRGESAVERATLWGDLPGEGNFAVICPAGEGRRTRFYSWGAPGQIADLARMPRIVRAHGVDVDRVYAIGGSMGGQEVLLLVARDPHLLAGAAAFDPATNMAIRYRAFAKLPDGRKLQTLARREVGGTPTTDPRGYAERSPAYYVRQIAFSGVPLQLYWSRRDRVIVDQVAQTGRLGAEIRRLNPGAKLWDFEGDWKHTAEMLPTRRLPRALARFGLLPWSDAPTLGTATPGPSPFV